MLIKRLLLLLPLLLLAACKPAEPPKPTPKQVSDVLLRQIFEIQDELDRLLAEAKAAGDYCLNRDTIPAGMEMMAPKYRALGVVLEAQGEFKQAMQAKGVADKAIAEARKMRRACR